MGRRAGPARRRKLEKSWRTPAAILAWESGKPITTIRERSFGTAPSRWIGLAIPNPERGDDHVPARESPVPPHRPTRPPLARPEGAARRRGPGSPRGADVSVAPPRAAAVQ